MIEADAVSSTQRPYHKSHTFQSLTPIVNSRGKAPKTHCDWVQGTPVSVPEIPSHMGSGNLPHMAGKSPGRVDDCQGTPFDPSLGHEVTPLGPSILREISSVGVTSLKLLIGNSGKFPRTG